ncbi:MULTISPECIES: sensor histidine kinase [Gordonia]|uniref:sensor histidine kinase n=1 Tax=Gordonia TaxID=2053 RepID=UPI00040EBF9D|nr:MULTISPECIES: histidine kinase [Gordonia]MDH3021272.1 histidine kinase [Gordonia alkanivorans]MDJ0008633.1 histidine kinase [Gordonia alkanivorans]MDJ0098651.1 histidine kinase [Gordonia alkanivorans]MDJ0494208.1 histidine kinase [Gordonia alkanivorans]QGP89842.1 two-component sensor histidine kinase [Gordonia sp. 135]
MDLDERWVRFARRRPLISSVVVAGLVAVGTVLALRVVQRGGPGDTSLEAALLGVAASAFLVAKNRAPLVSVAGTTAGAVIYIVATGSFNSAMSLPPAIALYTIASRYPMRRAMTVTAAAAGALLAASFIWGDDWLPVERIGAVGWLFLGMCVGALGRARNGYLEAMKARAEAAESQREVEAAQAVLAERMRIARDIHDAVAHHLTAINLQIGTARRLVHARPEVAEQMLAQMHDIAGAALSEVKATVGMLRRDSLTVPEPGAGMSSMPGMVEVYRNAGASVVVTVSGEERALPDDVDQVAYRVIQESLTNAVRHAPGTPVAVRCRYDDDAVAIVVENRLRPDDARAGEGGRDARDLPGLGMIGMRERVVAVGGTLDVRWVDDLFVVDAALPAGGGSADREATVRGDVDDHPDRPGRRSGSVPQHPAPTR